MSILVLGGSVGSGSGSFSLNTLTGATTLVAGTNGLVLNQSGTTITIDIPQDLTTTGNPTFHNLTVSGTLTASGFTAGDTVLFNSQPPAYYLDTSSGSQTKTGSLTVSSSVTASSFVGDGSSLTGSPTFSNLTVSGTLTASGFTAGDTVLFNSQAATYYLDTSSSNQTKLGSLTVSGNVSANDFYGSGANLTGTAASLNIGGNAATATLASNASLLNGYPSSNFIDTSSALQTKAGSLHITGATTVGSNLLVSGTASVISTLGVGGDIDLTGTLYAGAVNTSGGAINGQFHGDGTYITGSPTFTNLTVSGTLTASGFTAGNTNLFNGQAAAYYVDTSSSTQTKAGNLHITGATTVGSNLLVSGTASVISTLGVGGDITTSGTIYGGAVNTSGGSISGAFYGDGSHITGSPTFTNLTVSGTLTASGFTAGNTTLFNSQPASYYVNTAGGQTVAGTTTLTNLVVTGSATISSFTAGNTVLLNGEPSSFYVDTSSTTQTKSGNLIVSGSITGTHYGDGSNLTGTAAAFTVGNASVAANASQLNGQLPAYYLNTAGGQTVAGALTLTGNVNANAFYGDGSHLTGSPTYSNLTVTGSLTASGFVAGNTLQLNGQPASYYLNTAGGQTIAGSLAATTYYGDASHLTGTATNLIVGNANQLNSQPASYYLNTAGGQSISGALTATGNITANAFYGDGTNITGLSPVTTINPNLYRSGSIQTITRNLTSIVAESTSVAAFGVVGNGTHDDTTAFQNAVSTMAVNGGWLRIPGGFNIKLSGSVTIPSNLKVIGDGYGLSTITAGGGYSGMTGLLNLAPNTTNVVLSGFKIEGLKGDNVTGALSATDRLSTSSLGNCWDNQHVNGTSIWISYGCSNILIEDININHTAGYAIAGFALNSGNISGVTIRKCLFSNNRASVFDGYYGSWNGGILFINNGTDSYIEDLTVEQCVFKRCTGNCFWTHVQNGNGYTSYPAYYNRNVRFVNNYGEDIGLDFTEPSGIIGYTETGNHVRRFGFLCVQDYANSSTSNPRWNPNTGTPSVAFDTSGWLYNATRSNNTADGNGQMFDLDGCGLSTISNNTYISSFVSDDPITTAQLSSCGLSGVNWTKFINCGNTNRMSKAGSFLTMTGNLSYGAGGGAFLLYGVNRSKCSNNIVYHPVGFQSAPVILGNLGATGNGPAFHAYDNDVCHNAFHNDPSASTTPAVAEANNSVPFLSTDSNRVHTNSFSPTNMYEFLKDPNTTSGSYSSSPSPSTGISSFVNIGSCSSQPVGIVEAHLLSTGTQTSNFQFQIWSNTAASSGASPTGSQMLTLTPTAAYVPALGIGSVGCIDSSRNFSGNSLTIGSTVSIDSSNNGTLASLIVTNPYGNGISLRDTVPGGNGSIWIDGYTYPGATTQTSPSTRYLMQDSAGYTGQHIFYTAAGGSPNTGLVERFHIYANGDVNMNGNFKINGGVVINSSGQYQGGLNTTSGITCGGLTSAASGITLTNTTNSSGYGLSISSAYKFSISTAGGINMGTASDSGLYMGGSQLIGTGGVYYGGMSTSSGVTCGGLTVSGSGSATIGTGGLTSLSTISASGVINTSGGYNLNGSPVINSSAQFTGTGGINTSGVATFGSIINANAGIVCSNGTQGVRASGFNPGSTAVGQTGFFYYSPSGTTLAWSSSQPSGGYHWLQVTGGVIIGFGYS